MTRRKSSPGSFEERRRKEQLAFLVVKFLRAFTSFQSISRDFFRHQEAGCLAGCGVFEQVQEMVQSLVFDLKEKAHFLFRAEGAFGVAAANPGDLRDTRHRLAAMKQSIETRTIDSYIGTGYHLLQILQESLYQIERYTPELEKEKGEISRITELARAAGYSFSSDEEVELARLRALAGISEKLAVESAELAMRVAERCQGLFVETAEVIRHYIASARDNEILILNLLQHRRLLEQVYGPGADEQIFSELCKGRGFAGTTGLERAEAYVRARCGNVTALPTL
jgi:hypothetical protein